MSVLILNSHWRCEMEIMFIVVLIIVALIYQYADKD